MDISDSRFFRHVQKSDVLRQGGTTFRVALVPGGTTDLRVTKVTAESGALATTHLFCFEGDVWGIPVTGFIDGLRGRGHLRATKAA